MRANLLARNICASQSTFNVTGSCPLQSPHVISMPEQCVRPERTMQQGGLGDMELESHAAPPHAASSHCQGLGNMRRRRRGVRRRVLIAGIQLCTVYLAGSYWQVQVTATAAPRACLQRHRASCSRRGDLLVVPESRWAPSLMRHKQRVPRKQRNSEWPRCEGARPKRGFAARGIATGSVGADARR
jgi:hypothetical protein